MLKQSRKNYKKIWENHYKQDLPINNEIHHIDGNHSNNSVDNLLAVTIEEHLDIHLKQNDYAACQAILMRMEMTDANKSLIKEMASKYQYQLLDKGIHNFQKPETILKRVQAVKDLHEERKSMGLPAFLGIEDRVENARKAGKKSAELCAGFLDTNSPNHGSNHVKNTKWWTHISGERLRSIDCPGLNWQRGMKYEG